MKLNQFRGFLTKKKRNSDPIFCRLFYRPISLYLAWIFFKIGINANTVTIFSIFLTFLACFLFIYGNVISAIFGSIIFMLIAICDCIDGNIARASEKLSIKGEWLDASLGYILYGFQPISLGIYLEKNSYGNFFQGFWIIIGALISILNLLSRIFFQKYINIISKFNSTNQVNLKSSFSIGNEIGMVGFMMPLLIIATLIQRLDIYIIFYFLIYTLTFIYVFFNISKKLENFSQLT